MGIDAVMLAWRPCLHSLPTQTWLVMIINNWDWTFLNMWLTIQGFYNCVETLNFISVLLIGFTLTIYAHLDHFLFSGPLYFHCINLESIDFTKLFPCSRAQLQPLGFVSILGLVGEKTGISVYMYSVYRWLWRCVRSQQVEVSFLLFYQLQSLPHKHADLLLQQ